MFHACFCLLYCVNGVLLWFVREYIAQHASEQQTHNVLLNKSHWFGLIEVRTNDVSEEEGFAINIVKFYTEESGLRQLRLSTTNATVVAKISSGSAPSLSAVQVPGTRFVSTPGTFFLFRLFVKLSRLTYFCNSVDSQCNALSVSFLQIGQGQVQELTITSLVDGLRLMSDIVFGPAQRQRAETNVDGVLRWCRVVAHGAGGCAVVSDEVREEAMCSRVAGATDDARGRRIVRQAQLPRWTLRTHDLPTTTQPSAVYVRDTPFHAAQVFNVKLNVCMGRHVRATEQRHQPYGITHCLAYLPLDRGECEWPQLQPNKPRLDLPTPKRWEAELMT